MKSKISFYSFKGTETVTARPYRKDKCSNFQQFQLQRLLEKRRQQPCYQKKKHRSSSVLVQSEEEKQLLSFLKVPNLPVIKMLSPKKKSLERCQDQSSQKRVSSLNKILKNKKKFMKKYFRTLKQVQEEEGIQKVRHVFEEVNLGSWSVVGYLKGNDIIFKAKHKSGRERYIKYRYDRYIEEIKTNYHEFVREKMQLQLLLKSD